VADLKKKLKDANKLWKGAKKRASEQASPFTEYDDGRYMARLQGGEITTSEGGRLQLVWSWKFEDEPYEGKIKKAYQGLETEDNLVFLARDLERLGYESPDDLAGVEEVLADIKKEKPLARIRLKTKGDFQNVYIDKVWGDEDSDDAEDDSDDETESVESSDEGEEEAEETEEEDGEETDEEEADEAESDDVEEESDEDDAEEEDDGVEVEVGMRVEVETSKGKKVGEIIEILEADGKVRVKTPEGIVKVGVDKVTLAVPEEPAKKPAKKAAAPAPKPEPEPKPAKAKVKKAKK
jgi:hypothetical protein